MKVLKNKYILTILISLLILSIIYIYKGIFPFGDNSVIWSDMHEQITALYYRFYDAVHGGSLLVDFGSGGAVNFLGVMAYYILSPFTALVLLFPRDMIPQAVSLIVGLKLILSAVTCMFFVDRYFNKLKTYEKVSLSLLYAFSSYTLVMYIITGWMDIVYLFPLLMVGLKELLDLKDKKLYILVLALAFIFNNYLTLIVLIFILLASGIYLYVFNKKNMKKGILTLGICTIIAMLLSSIIVVPAVLQTLESERAGIDLKVILNSNKGPLADKISLLFTSGPLIALTILLLINYKKHKKFSSFIFPVLLLVGLPILVEPINKIWHFGSYIYFPYRYGFIFIFLLVIAAAYYLEKVDNKFEIKKQDILSIGGVLLTLGALVLAVIKKSSIRGAIYRLSLTKNKTAFLIMLALFVLIVVTTLLLEFKKNKRNRILLCSIGLISILFNSYLYFGFYNFDYKLKERYDIMNDLYELKDETGYYNVKEKERYLIRNNGMVTGLRTFTNFTSLTEKNNFNTFQKLGYDSYWMDTESIGGNLFVDTILGYKYLLTKEEYNSPYYDLFKEYDGIKVYKYNRNMPYGYILSKNDNLEHALDNISNSFESSNIIYNYISGKESIFDIIDLETDNIEKGSIIEKEIEVTSKKEVYLELFTEFESAKKTNTYESFNIYVNDQLFMEKYPNTDRNGTLDLGLYENTKLNIKIEVLKKVKPRNITVGLLDLNKYDEFIETNYGVVELIIDGNEIDIKTSSAQPATLFVPIPNIGYDVKDVTITSAFGNFLAIPLNYGTNIFELTYTSKGILPGLILSVIGLILLLLVDRVNMFDGKFLTSAAYIIYMGIYYIIIGMYAIGVLAFLISFVHRI